jgi:hypothetical protein
LIFCHQLLRASAGAREDYASASLEERESEKYFLRRPLRGGNTFSGREMRAVRIHRNAVAAAAAAPRRTTIQFRYQLAAENKRETLPVADRPRQQLHIRREVRAFARRRLLIQVVPTDN